MSSRERPLPLRCGCGSDELELRGGAGLGTTWLECQACGKAGVPGDTPDLATRFWNREILTPKGRA